MSEAPPVILLHGTNSGPWVLSPLKTALEEQGRTVRAPGYARFGTGDLGKGLEELVGRVRGILPYDGPVDVVGHSLGGLMALRLARHPVMAGRVRRVVGLGACWRGVEPEWHHFRGLIRRLAPALLQIEVPVEEPVVPDGVAVYSVVSTGDTVVPQWSARLGAVTTVEGVPHSGLPALSGLVTGLLD